MRGPAIVLAVLLPLASASAQDRGPMPSISAAAPPSAMEQAPRMPEGPLLLLGRTPGEVHFLALSDLGRRDDVKEATVLSIADPGPLHAGRPAPMTVSRHAIWCARRTFADYHAWYAEDGVLLDAARDFTERPIVAESVDALLAAILCDPAASFGQPVDGHAAALTLGRRMLRGG